MMKKTCFLFLLLLCGVVAIAQDFEIVSVESLPADMSAREEMKTDHNDRQCALLRVATQNIAPNQREGFSFVPDLGSEVVERATRDGEIWLWVSPGIKYLRIKHRDWGQYELRLLDFVSRVEALHTYKITIRVTLSLALQEQGNNTPTQQYLAFRITPANATLFVNDELWDVGTDGTAVRFVNFGSYDYRVMAPNHVAQTGTVIVNDPDNTQTVPVNLKPDFVEVTLKVDADAEIWVNNAKKGTHSWTGNLGKGTYKIECKQTGHENSMITKEITADLNGQTINLPKPTPIYGSLNIESTPSFATVYIDGEEVGKTPKCISEILIGEHKVKLHVEGFRDYVETVLVNCEEKNLMQVEMKIVEAPEGAIKGIFSVSPTKKVYFSKGNLQYKESTKTWRFAERQWDYIGEKARRVFYNGWIDLFGWGTSGYSHREYYFDPCSTMELPSCYYAYDSKDSALYNHTGMADWGYNKISNGGNKENLWRTLTIDEWQYVFDTRTTSSGIRFVRGQVNGVNGIILLPDDWNSNYYELKNVNSDNLYNPKHNIKVDYQDNVIEKNVWNDLFEANGAVFLPASGYRSGYTVFSAGSLGEYWSSDPYYEYVGKYYFGGSDVNASCLYFSSDIMSFTKKIRYRGESVRLVYDCQQ